MQPNVNLVKFVSKFNDSVSFSVFLFRPLTDAEQEKLSYMIRKLMGSELISFKDAVAKALDQLEINWHHADPDIIVRF